MLLESVLALIILLVAQSNGAKILGVFPFPARSHSIVQKSLMLELARRGHEVTILTHFLENESVPNITEIYLNFDVIAPTDLFKMHTVGPFTSAMHLFLDGKALCESVLRQENVQKLIHAKNLHFDLVVIEAFQNDCMLGFAHKFNTPVIQLCPYGGSFYISHMVGNPNPTSYVPDEFLELGDKMNFVERMLNTIFQSFRLIVRELVYISSQDEVMKKYFNDSGIPSVRELEKRTALVLVNSHFSFSYVRTMTPNYVQVGGMHIKPSRKLPEDLQKYMDNSGYGVVYFSMGSHLSSSHMPKCKVNALLKAFSKLKQNILWKWENDTLPGQPKNVMFRKWFPQSDILAHEKMLAFVTHGGLLSQQETVNSGVPIVGIPIYGDQPLNVKRAVLAGYGIWLDYENLTEESIIWAINEVIENRSYRENAQRLSRIFRDQPLKPLEQAVFWTEYVIRHKGAPHMRSAALDLTWYQYYLLDVIAVLTIATCAVLMIVYFTLKFMLKKYFGYVLSRPNVTIQRRKIRKY